MVKLSSYSNGYEDGKFELMPWEFWTEQEKSQVIYQAYKDQYLNSKQVKNYLDVSRQHMVTQFVGPALAGVLYFGVFKNSIASTFYRRSPSIGNLVGLAFVAATSIVWLNLSPYYARKEAEQEKTLDVLYHKIGPSMRQLNDLIPRTRTSTDIDFRTRMIYSQRNGLLAGTVFAEEDQTPPIQLLKKVDKYEDKKIYL